MQNMIHTYIPEEAHKILKSASIKFDGANIPLVAARLIKAGAEKLCPECCIVDNCAISNRGRKRAKK